jgi:hypothetical protein
MEQMGFGGSLRIAETLARQGIKISNETIRCSRKNPRKPNPRENNKGGPVLKAKHPSHVWMIDITEIKGFLGLFTYRFAVMLDNPGCVLKNAAGWPRLHRPAYRN